jgi:heme-degrading monooxygenase HmoA
LFLRSERSAAALTFWEDADSVQRLDRSATYRATVQRLQETGLLTGTQTVDAFQIAAQHLEWPLVERFLGRIERPSGG